MEKFSVDIDRLYKTINAPKRIRLDLVKDQLKKVAFDVVTFRDQPESLWQITTGEDGNQYIVAMYSDSDNQKEVTAWSIQSDKLNKNATIFYKGTPVTSINFAQFGIKEEDVDDFKHSIPKALATNTNTVKSLLRSVDSVYSQKLASLHPELYK